MNQTDLFGSKEIREKRNRRECNYASVLLFRITLFIICLPGFIYEAKVFLNLYWSYPEVTDIEIETERDLILPAYTFCESNNVFRKHFCTEYPSRCGNSDKAKEISTKYHTVHGVDGKQLFHYSEGYFEYAKMKYYGRALTDLLIYLNKNGEDYSTTLGLESNTFFLPDRISREVFKCYAINSRVDTYEYPSKYKLGPENSLKKRRLEVLKLRFRINLNDSSMPWIRPGVYFHIHSPFIAVNPSEEGIFLKPGKSYEIRLHLEEEQLLPFPYSSDCVNYTSLWEQNNRKGVRSQEMCLSDCHFRNSFGTGAGWYKTCAPVWIKHPHRKERCFTPTVYEFNKGDDPFSSHKYNTVEMQTCLLKCKPDCVSLRYHYTFEERQSYNIQEKFRIKYELPRVKTGRHTDRSEVFYENETIKFIDVSVTIPKPEIRTIRQKPKYQKLELFSCIGRLLGCFLGISFVAFADIIPLTYALLKKIFLGFKQPLNVCRK